MKNGVSKKIFFSNSFLSLSHAIRLEWEGQMFNKMKARRNNL